MKKCNHADTQPNQGKNDKNCRYSGGISADVSALAWSSNFVLSFGFRSRIAPDWPPSDSWASLLKPPYDAMHPPYSQKSSLDAAILSTQFYLQKNAILWLNKLNKLNNPPLQMCLKHTSPTSTMSWSDLSLDQVTVAQVVGHSSDLKEAVKFWSLNDWNDSAGSKSRLGKVAGAEVAV